MRVDRMGNLIALKRATPNAKGKTPLRIMLSAHMDEIGLIITHIDDNGFARFNPVGGLRTLTLTGNRVLFADGAIGTIQIEKGPRAANEAPGYDQMFIDTGAADKKSSRIAVGNMGALLGSMVQQGERVIGKSLDDRVGVFVLIETFRQLKHCPHDVYAVFSVQEEVGLRGARTSAYGVNPDIGIALDSRVCDDALMRHSV